MVQPMMRRKTILNWRKNLDGRGGCVGRGETHYLSTHIYVNKYFLFSTAEPVNSHNIIVSSSETDVKNDSEV